MKTKLLALIALSTVLSTTTLAAEPTVKSVAREAISAAIAHREAPGSSRRKEPTAEEKMRDSKRSHLPSYYSAQKNLPALPFNPFPNLPVHDLGGNRFMYDDSEVDYASRRSEQAEVATAEGVAEKVAYASETPAGQNGLPEASLADGVRLKITKTGSSTFSLLATNLTPGTEYLVTDKLKLTNNLGTQWRPLVLFTAASNSMTFSGSFAEDQDFFQVWNYDLYEGPVIALTAPSAGAVLSGRVKVSGTVSDIFPDRVAELYVDGDMVTAITNGPLEFDFDTQMFTNGIHTLDIVVRTVLLTTNFLEFASVTSVSATFSNFLTSVDNGPFFSGGAALLKFKTTGAAGYTLDVFDGNQTLKRTFTGTTAGGTFQIVWDRRDTGGNLLPAEAPYTFRMTTVEGTGGGGGVAAAPITKQVVINSFAEGTFNAGYAFLVRLKLDSAHQDFEAIWSGLMQNLDSYIYYADLFGPDAVGTRDVLNQSVFVWLSNAQRTNILNSIKRKDVGHFFFAGHGNGEVIGSGGDTIITAAADIRTTDVVNTLTNDFNLANGVYNFKNPKRYVELDGCNTSTGNLPLAFGIPKFSTDRRPNIARRSFFGWNQIIQYGNFATKYQVHTDNQRYAWHDPDTQISIQSAIVTAIVAGNYQIDVRQFGLFGSRLLTWAENAP